MRILVVARPFVIHGGVERATAGLLGGLVARGHEVHLLAPGLPPPVPGVRHHALALPPLPPVARLLALAAAGAVVAGRRTWDVVQSHERTLRQDVYRAGEGCHRAYLAVAPARGRRAYHATVLALERRVFARSRHVVAIARAGAAEIAALYGVAADRLSVVYNGVDLERFHPRLRAEHRLAARAEAGVPADARLALFVGSGFERKGLATAIEALAAAPDPALHLLVVGKGDPTPYRHQADRAGVAARVAWLGARADVERWYGAADVLVVPTRYEPFGNVHLEALAAGLPVIASARAGGAELVEPGVNGAIVDPVDAGAVARALAGLCDGDARAMAEAARRAAEPFTHARQAEALERIYRRCMAARGDFP